MSEEAKETRICKQCGKEYEYIEGSALGSGTIGSFILGSDPNLCDECADKRESKDS